MKPIFLIFFILAIGLTIIFQIFIYYQQNDNFIFKSYKISLNKMINIVNLKDKKMINIVNLKENNSLEFNGVNCKRSNAYKFFYPMFCVHDPKKDGISGDLWNDKLYEEDILSK